MDPIAIVGIAFKLPQDLEDEGSFWEIVEKGKNVMTGWPKSRVNIDAFTRSHDAPLNTVGNDILFTKSRENILM